MTLKNIGENSSSIQKDSQAACPKCNWPRSPGQAECDKCGVVFHKIRKDVLSGQKSLTSLVRHQPDDFLFRLITGLGKSKKYLECIFEQIVGVMWNRLTRGSSELSKTGNLIAFLIFSAFSILSYYGRDYQDFFVICLLIFWWLDCHIALFRYRRYPVHDRIHMRHAENDELLLLRVNAHGQIDSENLFSPHDMRMIVIERHQPRGGIFQEVMDEVWQGYLILKDSAPDRFINAFRIDI